MSRYENTNVGKDLKKKVNKYNTTIYKTVPERNDDIIVLTQEGDRLDNLAFQFYGDSSMWWFIAHVNRLNSLNVESGLTLRIPISTEYAIGD